MVQRKASPYSLCLLILASGWIIAGGACGSPQAKTYTRNHSHSDAEKIPDERIARGQTLAATWCASCHMVPDPGLLDAQTWENGVLPQMGPRLGIFEYMEKKYPNNSGDPNVGRDFYPSAPVMTADDWGSIIDYYTSVSPDTLPEQKRSQAITTDPGLFAVSAPAPAAAPPATCFIGYEPRSRQIWTADIIKHTLDQWNGKCLPVGSLATGGSIVSMIQSEDGYAVCNIGAFAPNNAKAGHIDRLRFAGGKLSQDTASIYDRLMRPVNLAAGDLNGDGKEDLVVCEFGFIKGELAWLENKGKGQYDKHVLRNIPGAIHAVIGDYNHDGLPDIWVLFAQGEEGIFLYTNKGHGQFEEKEILRFPPCYGSTYFELDDLNHDGNPDIIYTCGDNGDFSTVLKPYHGVYIFMNDGKGSFAQKYFFPINGCYRAMAADLNGDGKTDIAAIAYFADFQRQPEEGFVYLQNEGDLSKGEFSFKPHSVPGTEAGRWITMDILDVNGDGKPDILLANCSVGPGFIKSATDWKKGPPWMLLTNQGK